MIAEVPGKCRVTANFSARDSLSVSLLSLEVPKKNVSGKYSLRLEIQNPRKAEARSHEFTDWLNHVPSELGEVKRTYKADPLGLAQGDRISKVEIRHLACEDSGTRKLSPYEQAPVDQAREADQKRKELENAGEVLESVEKTQADPAAKPAH